MFHHKTYCSKMDEGVTGPASFQNAEATENEEDEMDIIGDQDETIRDDRVMGGIGKSPTPITSGEFERGEIDMVEQMNRVTRAMDHATHRSVDTAPPARGPEGHIDTTAVTSDNMNNRKPYEDERVQHTQRGEKTGAFTDLGAGRSGVTRKDKH